MQAFLDNLVSSNGQGLADCCRPWAFDFGLLAMVAEGLTVLGCVMIAANMFTFALRRSNFPYRRASLLIAALIFISGLGRLTSVFQPWFPTPAFEGGVKVATALVTIASLVFLRPLRPFMPPPEPRPTTERPTMALETELAQRRNAETILRWMNDELEQRVAARTAQLADANRALLVEARERERTERHMRQTVEELQAQLQARAELEQRVAERSRELEAANHQLAREVDERRRAEAGLRTALIRLERFMTNTPLGVVEWHIRDDGLWVIERWTGDAEAIFGWDAEAAVGRTEFELELISAAEHARAVALNDAAIARGELQNRVTLRCRTRNGETRICSFYHSFLGGGPGDPPRVLSLIEDVSERVETLARAEWLASHDPLTGLPNRTLFHDRLQQAVTMARRRRERLAVMMIDLDHFKAINDALGHAAGDSVLRELARRLTHAGRESDTVGRFGGDEFALLQTGLADPAGAMALAQRLADAVVVPFTVGDQRVDASLSAGVALFPEDGTDPETLLQAADLALYRAKRSGRRGFRLYDRALDGPAGAPAQQLQNQTRRAG